MSYMYFRIHKSHDVNMADRENAGDGDSQRRQDQLSSPTINGQKNGRIEVDLMDQAYAEEYQNLDKTLDEIDSWMNKLEEQNDTLFQELDTLLESNKQTRKELQELSSQQPSSDNTMETEETDETQEKS